MLHTLSNPSLHAVLCYSYVMLTVDHRPVLLANETSYARLVTP